MIIYTTGDLLSSDAQALVNTVNCEGYMGKGIAYQFKLKYPENNISYVKACKSGELRIGTIHYFFEQDKLIINFPTKNKWRENSKLDYIITGLNKLKELIIEKSIKSIAIPPLGSGNGGLVWSTVKTLIEENLSDLENTQIFVYEPSKNYVAKSALEPKLSTSALILLNVKIKLKKFDTTRLQKTAYMINIFSGEQYFKFNRHKFGPFDNSISVISKSIKEYQDYHQIKDPLEVYNNLYKKLSSESVNIKLNKYKYAIENATSFVNNISSNHELECLTTVLFLIEEGNVLEEKEIVRNFMEWSEDKAKRFNEIEVLSAVEKLDSMKIIEKTFLGYKVCQSNL